MAHLKAFHKPSLLISASCNVCDKSISLSSASIASHSGIVIVFLTGFSENRFLYSSVFTRMNVTRSSETAFMLGSGIGVPSLSINANVIPSSSFAISIASTRPSPHVEQSSRSGNVTLYNYPSFLNIAGKAYLLILILLFAIDRRSFSLSLISKTSNNTQIILTLVDHRINRYNLFWLIHFVKNYILLCDEDQVPLTTQD